MTKSWLAYSFTVALAAQPAIENWPQFRGPNGQGTGIEKTELSAVFGPEKALLWKTSLPSGHSSPCIWADRIFTTAYDNVSGKLEVIALNRNDGRIVWRKTVRTNEIEKVHQISSPATATPATDGEKVYVYFGSYGLLAYRWNGEFAWEYPMEVAQAQSGSGTSPVLVNGLVLLTRDNPPNPWMIAVFAKDGKLAWKADLEKSTQAGPRTAHATPILWRDQIVLNRPGSLSGYAVADGKPLWWMPTASTGTSTPTSIGDLIYVNAFSINADPEGAVALKPFSYALEKYDRNKDGKLSEDEIPADDLYIRKRAGIPDNVPGAHFNIKLFFRTLDSNHDGFIEEKEYKVAGFLAMDFNGAGVASGVLSIRPAGNGRLPATALAWSEKRNVSEVTTPLVYRGRVYTVTSGGIVSCLDAKTGKVIYRGRVNAPGAYFASPVAAGGRIFLASSEGVVTVLNGGETLEVMANNDLGEPIYGTPALIGSVIYVRSAQHMWAFGKQ